ncbi:NifU family protein [Phascolarctobacterium faecium]|uniref:NifU family protein n=1 Tax=Phascolarctobacterium faecium TaxID=33025 RepID=UPI003FD6DCF2
MKTEDKIKEILSSLRPYLNMEGGDIEFVKYEDKIVYIKLTGACAACMFSDDTIQYSVFETLKSEIPEIEKVINVEI